MSDKRLHVFISIPMMGFQEEEVATKLGRLQNKVRSFFEPTKVTFIKTTVGEDPPKTANPGAWYLGESIKRLSRADYVIFAEGFELYRGCRLEYDVVLKYGMQYYHESQLKKKGVKV